MDTKLVRLYKKLTIANLLNWFAMRLFYFSEKVCKILVSFAIYLDNSRIIFKKNYCYISREPRNNFLKFKQLTLPNYSVLEGCRILEQKILFIVSGKLINLSLPYTINKHHVMPAKAACEVMLPAVYLSEINDAIVFGGTDLCVIQDTILYDEIDRKEKYSYGIKPLIIQKVNTGTITIKFPLKIKHVESAIHFTKDHSKNYFHWIVECLPRLSLIEDLDINIPLIVDDDLPEQFYEALQLINKTKRKIIKLNAIYACKVKKLYYPSQLSILRDNYGTPFYDKDVIISPQAISYIRKAFFSNQNILKNKDRKIYVSRNANTSKRLLNSLEIENLLVKYGFEIVFPEYLSFAAQKDIFSQARLVIGPAGAAMTNIIFLNKDCEVIMLTGDAPNMNLHAFNILSQEIGFNLKFLIGTSQKESDKVAIAHSNFTIDIDLLREQIENIMNI